MTGPLFADTNLLIYSLDPGEPGRQAKARLIIGSGMETGRLLTSPQVLNECYSVLTGRKKMMPPAEAQAFLRLLFPTCRAEMNLDTIAVAFEIEAETRFGWWDSLLLSSAIRAGCTHFLTEDLSDRRDVRGMTLLNPFTNDVSSLLS